MGEIKIRKSINNLELIAKLMNSVAVKWDCRVKYDSQNNSLIFSGDDKYKQHVVEETMIFFPTLVK